MDDSKYTFTCNDTKYAVDIQAIKDFCLVGKDENLREHELTESYEWDDEVNEMQITNRITRDVKGGNEQNDMIVYDLVKLFLIRLLDNASPSNEFDMDFSTSLALNTLIKFGMVVEVKE